MNNDTKFDNLINSIKPKSTFFQLNYFVVGKEPTDQAKMHRCLQEIKDRCTAIVNTELEIEELLDVNELFNIDSTKEKHEVKQRQINRKIKANESRIENHKSNIAAWTEEINFLKHLYNQIEKETPLKPWDDYDVQLEYWSEKMSQEIKSRLILNAPVDIEVIKTTMALPDKAPVKRQLLECIEKKQLSDK